jgi:hypothetical protein
MALPLDVKRDIAKQAPKLAKRELLLAAKNRVEDIKESLIKDFLAHPVTVEILAGPNSQNTSGLLGGRGNLFSFIGFSSGDSPIDPILSLFENIRSEFGGFTTKGINIFVSLPDPKDVFSVTPMPWATGRSWAKGIETGISGLGYYLLTDSNRSRSGVAIQSDKQVLGGVRFRNTQYISSLLNKYKSILENDTILSS